MCGSSTLCSGRAMPRLGLPVPPSESEPAADHLHGIGSSNKRLEAIGRDGQWPEHPSE